MLSSFMNIVSNGLATLLVFIGISTPIIVIGLVYYFKKRLEHTQIMAAIEKGTPLSELRPVKKKSTRTGPAWISEYTSGITCLVIAAGFILILLAMSTSRHNRMPAFPFAILYVVPIVFLANGIGAIMRGKILKKNYPELNNVPPETPEGTAPNTDIQSD